MSRDVTQGILLLVFMTIIIKVRWGGLLWSWGSQSVWEAGHVQLVGLHESINLAALKSQKLADLPTYP
jgi:hypothetical protein